MGWLSCFFKVSIPSTSCSYRYRIVSCLIATYCFLAVTSRGVRPVDELRLLVVLVVREELLLLVDELDVFHWGCLCVPDSPHVQDLRVCLEVLPQTTPMLAICIRVTYHP